MKVRGRKRGAKREADRRTGDVQ